MSRALKIVGGLAAFVGFFAVSFVIFGHVLKPKSPQQIQADLEADVAKIKPTLPKQVHPIVTWFDVEAGWHTITYKYKIDAPRAAIAGKKSQLQSELKNSLAGWAARLMISKEIKIQCELYDQNGGYVMLLDL